MSNFVKYPILLIFALCLLAIIVYAYQISAPASGEKPAVNFEIKPGEGVNQISQNLYEQKLIRSKFYFEIYAWLKDVEASFIVGEYQLLPSMNIGQITRILTRFGSTEKTITIIEGWNNKEISAYLEQQGLFNQQSFLDEVGYDLLYYYDRYDFLSDKPQSVDLEGYLFPDTYRVYKNSTPKEVVLKMLENFGQKLNEDLRSKIRNQNKSIFEIITLASIIEKEVRGLDDMKMVADVFYKRLKKGMALQSDATVNYVTGKGLVQPTAEDLKFDNLYNTYIYPGLPPGPISNPGFNAIMAAVEPTLNQYYYFLTTPEGEVIYSKTYEEHLRNKVKYLE